MRAYLNSQVSGALSLWDPSEANLHSPAPSLLFLIGPDGGRLMPIDFGARGLAKHLEDALSPVHVGGGTSKV